MQVEQFDNHENEKKVNASREKVGGDPEQIHPKPDKGNDHKDIPGCPGQRDTIDDVLKARCFGASQEREN
jgi:hypothetical protein